MKESESLREEFRDRHRETTERLVRIEDKLDKHKHPGLVSWVALVPILVALGLAVAQVLTSLPVV